MRGKVANDMRKYTPMLVVSILSNLVLGMNHQQNCICAKISVPPPDITITAITAITNLRCAVCTATRTKISVTYRIHTPKKISVFVGRKANAKSIQRK